MGKQDCFDSASFAVKLSCECEQGLDADSLFGDNGQAQAPPTRTNPLAEDHMEAFLRTFQPEDTQDQDDFTEHCY